MIPTALLCFAIGIIVAIWQNRYQPFESTNARLRRVVKEYDLKYIKTK